MLEISGFGLVLVRQLRLSLRNSFSEWLDHLFEFRSIDPVGDKGASCSF